MRIFIAVASSGALLWSSTAYSAPAKCVTRDQVAAMATAFLPIALKVSRERCGSLVPNASYLRSEEIGARLAKAEVEAQNAQKAAMDGFKVIAGDLPAEVSDRTMMSMMSDLATAELTKKLDASSCRALNDIFESTRAMSGTDMGMLVGTLMAFVGTGEVKKPEVCKL